MPTASGSHGSRSASSPAVATANPATRAEASDLLADLLERAVRRDRSVLVGFDFSFGYPAGFSSVTAAIAPAAGRPWERTWGLVADRVVEGPGNANNRFEAVASINAETGTALYWGRPRGARAERLWSLPARRVVPAGLAPNPCEPLRRTERLAPRGIGSGFQLSGRGSVGGQVLVGLPHLSRLSRRLGAAAAVWPFETGFTADPTAAGARVVMAEIWPNLFPLDPTVSTVRDEAQVLGVLRACAALDARGWTRWFDPPSVRALAGADRAVVVGEEGWILGVA